MSKKYTLLDQQNVDFVNGAWTYAVIIVVDTEDDIPEPRPDWTRGSICLINKGHQFKSLNSKGVWE